MLQASRPPSRPSGVSRTTPTRVFLFYLPSTPSKYIVSYATCAVLPPEHIWTAQASILRHLKLEKRLLHPRRCVSSRHPPLEHTSEPLGPSRLPLALYLAELHRDSLLDNLGACVLELGGQFRITSRGRKTRHPPYYAQLECSNLPRPRVPNPIGTRCMGSDFSTY